MERRACPRVPLDAPFFVTICLENGQRSSAILVDCGRGGVHLAFSPAEGMMSSLLGQNLVITNLPKGLGTDPDGWPGVVTWVSPQRCGVRFNQLLSLTDEELKAVANGL